MTLATSSSTSFKLPPMTPSPKYHAFSGDTKDNISSNMRREKTTQQVLSQAPSAPSTVNQAAAAAPRPSLPKERIIRRMPHGARRAGAESFEKAIKNVVQNNDEPYWTTSPVLCVSGFSCSGKLKWRPQSFACHHYERPPPAQKRKKPKKPENPNSELTRRVGMKIDDGDCSGAVRILMSTDAIAETSHEVLEVMTAKYPESPLLARSAATA
ncbi:uncharacterized protein LOC129596784 [Paramacrobiotus metropolitanus]|uniref:uncharacterized protein LOC129596784 n=1 Tax=Paramacrobiotus metropolitanus TaxID=2943436 RepID=UPI002445C13A|nr:uncharacterized protein LOC129596784 [Paramacrobiotus metropolitanus]